MAGQSTFSVKFQFNSGWNQVGVTGIAEYDFIRNTAAGEIDQPTYQAAIAAGKAPAPLLQIIARHIFTPTLNAGNNIIGADQVPFTWPILRLHLAGSTANDLSFFQFKADGQIVDQGYIGAQNDGAQLDQLKEANYEAGFNTTLFDYSYVADKTQRIAEALKISSSLTLTIQSAIAQGLTILQERLQNQFI